MKEKNKKIWTRVLIFLFLAGICISIAIHVKKVYIGPSTNFTYSNTYKAEDVYKWLLDSHLIASTNELKETEKNSNDPKLIKRLTFENNLSIYEYSYNREKYLARESFERSRSSHHDFPPSGDEIAFENLSIWIPYGVGDKDDFQKVLSAQHALPSLVPTYESNKAKKAVTYFQQKKSFVTLVHSFNSIDSSDQASRTYHDYLDNQEATWTGIVIHKEYEISLALYGKLDDYKGESLSLIRGEFNRYEKPLLDKIPYVFYVSLKNTEIAKKVTKGDVVTIKGNVSGYSYQAAYSPDFWSLENATIVNIQKGKQVPYPFDEKDVRDWFDRSHLVDLSPFKQEKQNDTYITFFRNLTDWTRVTVYSKLQPEKDIHPAHGGYEFTYRNVTVWTSLEKERLNRYKEVLKAEKPLENFTN